MQNPIKNERTKLNFKRSVVFDKGFDVPSQEYHHLYKSRLSALEFALEKSAKKKWFDKENIENIPNSLSEIESGRTCVLIGTLYKKMHKKRRALDAFIENNKERRDLLEDSEESYVSPNDKLYIENSEGRIAIKGLDPSKWTSGVSLAIRGHLINNSSFDVEDYCLPGLPTPSNFIPRESEEKYIAFISAPNIGCVKSFPAFKMVTDFLMGLYSAVKTKPHRIGHLVIVGDVFGDIFGKFEIDPMFDDENSSFDEDKANLVSKVDIILGQLSSCIPLTLMSGPKDPSSVLMPQNAMSRRLFPSCSVFETFNCEANPFSFECEGIKFMGSSGQNIRDICRNSRLEFLEAMEYTLFSRVLAPTAPDTIPAVPVAHEDPLVIDSLPNVYFCGGGTEFKSREINHEAKKVLLISLPDFSMNPGLVVIELSSLKVTEMRFDCDID